MKPLFYALTPTTAMSAAIFLFFCANLSWPMGYSLASGLALATALWLLFTFRPAFDTRANCVVFFCGLSFIGAIWAVLFHADPLRELDLPLRFLGMVILIWAGSSYTTKPMVFWMAVASGAASAAGIAFHDLHTLGLGRATGYTGGIQFGNIGLILGIFSAAGVVWAAASMKSYLKVVAIVLLTLACLLGLYTSLASGSRGGWVALPLVVLLFTLSLTPRLHALKMGIIVLLVCATAAAGLWVSPTFQTRTAEAISDIKRYHEEGNRETSVGIRFAIWEVSAQLIAKRPLAGWGDKGYRAEMKRGVEEGRFYPEVLSLANTHNTYLEAWLKYGIFGIVGLLGLLVSGFYLFAKQLRHPDGQVKAFAIAGTSLVSVYAVSSLTQIMLDRNNTVLFFVFSFAVLFSLMHARVDALQKQ